MFIVRSLIFNRANMAVNKRNTPLAMIDFWPGKAKQKKKPTRTSLLEVFALEITQLKIACAHQYTRAIWSICIDIFILYWSFIKTFRLNVSLHQFANFYLLSSFWILITFSYFRTILPLTRLMSEQLWRDFRFSTSSLPKSNLIYLSHRNINKLVLVFTEFARFFY